MTTKLLLCTQYEVNLQLPTATVTMSVHRGERTAQGFASDLMRCGIIGTMTARKTLFTPSLQSHMPSSLPLLL